MNQFWDDAVTSGIADGEDLVPAPWRRGKDRVPERLDAAVSEALMSAERSGLSDEEIVETVLGSMNIRPNLAQPLYDAAVRHAQSA